MLKFRPTSEHDEKQITEYIAADPDHAGRCEASFWLPNESVVEQFVAEDENGPVFYVRAENIMRLHIQFASDRKRVAKAIEEFTPWIVEQARQKGYKQIIFESVFKPLIRFLERRGFHSSPDEHIYDLRS